MSEYRRDQRKRQGSEGMGLCKWLEFYIMCNKMHREMDLCRVVMWPVETNAASQKEYPAVGHLGIRMTR